MIKIICIGKIKENFFREAIEEYLKRVFDKYGRIFRIGGDEFAVIIHAEEDKLNELMRSFEETVFA